MSLAVRSYATAKVPARFIAGGALRLAQQERLRSLLPGGRIAHPARQSRDRDGKLR